MITATKTVVLEGEKIDWTLIPPHPELYHKEIVNATMADALGITVSSILWEKIGLNGMVLPHYHNVAEIIHITVGKVRLLCNGEWLSFKAGDTFHVPTGVVHSVANDDVIPTEQISIFLPAGDQVPKNRFFDTFIVEVGVARG
jgi:mannose-6-phosphate isomerase-like protein (cupin superfamily)